MYIATPVALGSWWGLAAVVPFIAIMVYRINNEEAVLLRDLPGYVEYQTKTRYRLLPGIW
jgi:protein-S-isoprenylcysteine O-methyltransferase Ste14